MATAGVARLGAARPIGEVSRVRLRVVSRTGDPDGLRRRYAGLSGGRADGAYTLPVVDAPRDRARRRPVVPARRGPGPHLGKPGCARRSCDRQTGVRNDAGMGSVGGRIRPRGGRAVEVAQRRLPTGFSWWRNVRRRRPASAATPLRLADRLAHRDRSARLAHRHPRLHRVRVADAGIGSVGNDLRPAVRTDVQPDLHAGLLPDDGFRSQCPDFALHCHLVDAHSDTRRERPIHRHHACQQWRVRLSRAGHGQRPSQRPLTLLQLHDGLDQAPDRGFETAPAARSGTRKSRAKSKPNSFRHTPRSSTVWRFWESVDRPARSLGISSTTSNWKTTSWP